MKRTFIFLLSLILTSIGTLQTGFPQTPAQWYVPEGAVMRLGKGTVNGVTYSSDSTQLVIASSIGVWSYDVDTREERPLLTGYTGFVSSVTYAPGGKTLATGDAGGTVYLWDTATGEPIAPLSGHTDLVTSVVYSPDGNMTASGSRDSTVRLWNTNTSQFIRTLTGHTRWVTSVAFSPDGMRVASGSEDSTVRLWDANTGEHITTLTRHTGSVTSVVYSPNGKQIASGSGDGTIRLWDADTGQPITTLTGHTDGVTSVAYSPDGDILVSGSEDGTVHLWNTNIQRLIVPFVGHTERVTSVAYSPDGRTLVSGSEDGTVRLWNANTPQPITTLTGYIDRVTSIVYSPNSNTIASGSEDGTIRLWDTTTGQSVTTLIGGSNRIASVAYSPDGRTLASTGGAGDNTVHLWDITTGRSFATLKGHTSEVYGVTYSPDGRTIAGTGGFGDNTVRLWDAATGQLKFTLTGHTRRTDTVDFSPDSTTLVSGSRDRTVRLWDAATGQPKATLRGHTDSVFTVAYAPDGRTIASGGRDDTVRLWDVSTEQLKATLIGHTFSVRSVVYSPDGQTVASGGEDGTVRLWDAATGYAITTLTGHTGWVTSVAYSPDGETLASASEDGTIILWDFAMLHAQEQQLREAVSEFQQDKGQPKVQLIYFHPSDRVPQQGIEVQADRVIQDVQLFYARQMQNHGFGVKTFSLETDITGRTVVHHIESQFTEAHFRDQPYRKILEEIDTHTEFDKAQNVILVFLEGRDEILGVNVCGLGGVHQSGGGTAILPAAGDCFSFRIVAHELGHAFGLHHDFREPNLMADSSRYLAKLSVCAAEALNVHPTFDTPQSDLASTTIQWQPPLRSSSNTIRLRYELTDPDGLYQAQLITLSTPQDPIQGRKMIDCKQLNGERTTIEFVVSELIAASDGLVGIHVIDVHGNVTLQWNQIEKDSVKRLDVNEDGVVNILDLVLVASNFGQTGTSNRADVNGDDVVNIQDIVLVANGIGDASASAPLIGNTPTRADIQQWLMQARQFAATDAISQRGIAVLEHLLVTPTPKETSLLPNYPNPFNPETWIPYQLASDSDVSITIYDTQGIVVRQLVLGYQPTGYYGSRDRAAYWNGKNRADEPVASGIYFYQLQADTVSAVRKMLILK